MKLIIAGHAEIFREGLAKILSGQGFDVVALCSSGNELIETAKKSDFDVVLMSPSLTETPSLEAIEHIHHLSPEKGIVVLAHQEVYKDFSLFLSAGARGYIRKDTSIEFLVKSLSLVAGGEIVISSRMVNRVLEDFKDLEKQEEPNQSSNITLLSPREKEVLELVAQNLSYRDIGAKLFISEYTVKVHMRNITEKLGVRGRIRAADIIRRRTG